VFIEFIESISQIPQSLPRFALLNAFMLLFNWGVFNRGPQFFLSFALIDVYLPSGA